MFKRALNYLTGLFIRRSAPNWVYRQPMPHVLVPVRSGATVNEDTAVSWSAIWRGLQLVGSAIGSMPFTIQEETENGVITRRNHPLWRLVNMEPHPYYSTFDYLQAIIFQLLLRGNAVIVIERIGRNLGSNRPGALRVVSWDDVYNIREIEDNRLVYSIRQYGEVDSADIIHIKGVTKTGLAGLDTLKWNAESFGLALSSERASAAYHRNGTHSDGFLSTEQQIDPEKRVDIQKAWNDKVRSGETPVLTGGMKWNPIGVTPKDLQLLEVRQFNVYEAARLLGISPHLLYAMDRANFSNVETLSLEFSKFTLRFLVEHIEQEHNRKIFRGNEIGRLKVNLNMDAFLRGDTEARTKYLEGLLDRGVFSIDEARKIEGFNPLPDDKGKTHMVPLNFQTLDQMNSGGGMEDGPEPMPDDEPEPAGRKAKMNGHSKILN